MCTGFMQLAFVLLAHRAHASTSEEDAAVAKLADLDLMEASIEKQEARLEAVEAAATAAGGGAKPDDDSAYMKAISPSTWYNVDHIDTLGVKNEDGFMR
jgi:hypothetical protein